MFLFKSFKKYLRDIKKNSNRSEFSIKSNLKSVSFVKIGFYISMHMLKKNVENKKLHIFITDRDIAKIQTVLITANYEEYCD